MTEFSRTPTGGNEGRILTAVGDDLVWSAGTTIERYNSSTNVVTQLRSDVVAADGGVLPAFESFPLMFSADLAAIPGVDLELWISDGTPGGTTLLREINSSASSEPGHFVRLGTKTLFTADDGINGRELWVSDGTANGTQLLKDIRPGAARSNPLNLTKFGNYVYFSANNGTAGRELWRTDGTEAGTVLVKDILPGVGSGLYPPRTNWDEWQLMGDRLYFPATEGVNGTELWATDGTDVGTELVADITPGTPGLYSSPERLTAVGNTLLLTADHPNYGRELWRYSIPIARAAGPYTIGEGESLVISAATSIDPDGLPLTYSWDVNGDGTFGDATGVAPSLSWSQLQVLGINDGPTVVSNVRVRVNNSIGDSSTSPPTTVTVNDTVPVVAISGNGAVLENASYTLNLSAVDPGNDAITSWHITWQPGVVETITGNPSSVTHTYTVEGDYVISATATNDDGTFASNTLPVSVGVPPRVTASAFVFEQAHSIATTFSEDVSASLALADTTLSNLTAGFQLNSATMNLAYDGTMNVATIAFPGVPNALLSDGNYRLVLSSAGVTDPAGRLLDGDNDGVAGGDFVLNFFVFGGDANQDRAVNISDFAILAARFNQPGTFSQGDFNYDGVTGTGDFAILASKFNSNLPPPVPTFQRGELPSDESNAAISRALDAGKFFLVADRLIADWIDDVPVKELL